MSLRIILKWFPSRYPIFIFRLFHLKFFRIMFGWLKFFIFSKFGWKIDILCDVHARLSFVPAYPISSGLFPRSLNVSLIAVKWSISFFSSSHHKKTALLFSVVGIWLLVGGTSKFSEILAFHFSPISSTMKSSTLCFNFACVVGMSFMKCLENWSIKDYQFLTWSLMKKTLLDFTSWIFPFLSNTVIASGSENFPTMPTFE